MKAAVTYTSFDKVNKVKQGSDSLCYTYGYDQQRIFMEEHVGNTVRTKHYVGMCEYVTEASVTKSWTFLTGPYGVFAVVEKQNNTETPHYILKDNLGSWTTITNSSGTVEQQLSYDAWGNLRNPNTWANYTYNDTFDKPMFDRGYTGHEHLKSFGLINMNGRMYDPVMSSFLSADRFVQNPLNAQGFNRYAYCMYNPLRFVDPTGWAPRPGGGHGPDDPPPYVVIEGWASGYKLDEVIITSFYEFEYTPYFNTGGGGDLQWGLGDNSQPNSHTSGGGGGNHGSGSLPMISHYPIEVIQYQQFNYKQLMEYWQKKNPSLYWDKNGDGRLQKKEADDWWKNANGADVYIDNSLIDWSGLQIPDGIPEGEVFSIETIDAFICLPWETASTYGGTRFRVVDASTIEVLDQMYHYNMRSWNSPENIFRNIATIIGRKGMVGTDYMIHYYNPTIKIKKK